MSMYTVTIGDKTTRIRMNPNTILDPDEDWLTAQDYTGGNHNYDGIKGAAVEKAVKKLFGARCFWFGDFSQISRGQVFEALQPTKNNSQPGNSSKTNIVYLSVYREDK